MKEYLDYDERIKKLQKMVDEVCEKIRSGKLGIGEARKLDVLAGMVTRVVRSTIAGPALDDVGLEVLRRAGLVVLRVRVGLIALDRLDL